MPHEPPARFADLAQKFGIQMDILKLWENYKIPRINEYSRLLVLGGPQSVYDPLEKYPSKEDEINLIKNFNKMKKPVLGICLGGQLMAKAFGGRVYPNKVQGRLLKETGFYKVQLTENGESAELFKGFPKSFPVFQWHGDVFELPKNAKLLAIGEKARNQAFVYGKLAYGILFHLEFTPKIVEELVRIDKRWLHEDNYVNEREIIEGAYKNEETLKILMERLFNNWLNL